MFINKVVDHRKTVRFGFVTPKPRVRKFHCTIGYSKIMTFQRKLKILYSFKIDLFFYFIFFFQLCVFKKFDKKNKELMDKSEK